MGIEERSGEVFGCLDLFLHYSLNSLNLTSTHRTFQRLAIPSKLLHHFSICLYTCILFSLFTFVFGRPKSICSSSPLCSLFNWSAHVDSQVEGIAFNRIQIRLFSESVPHSRLLFLSFLPFSSLVSFFPFSLRFFLPRNNMVSIRSFLQSRPDPKY